MKTKALIAAAGLVWSLSSQALSILTVPNGEYRLIPACRGQSIIVLDHSSPQLELFKYNPVKGNYVISEWILGAWSLSELSFAAGEGAIVQASGVDANLLFQQPVAPKLPLQLQPGFNLVCCQTDIVATFEDVVGTPPANGTLLYQFNAGPERNPFNLAAPDYTIFTFANGAWSPTNPVVGITEAVFVYQPPQMSNAQVTSNGISFEIMPPINQQFVIEYTDSLTQPSWQTLTNVMGSGVSINVTDSSVGKAPQRFYRARSTP